MTTAPADRIRIFSFGSLSMRTLHLTWLMFFVCFFGWFGLAPLMPVIRADLGLTKAEVGNIIIASVSATIVARLVIGWCCDRWGPRLTAVVLLLLGSIPVLLVGLAQGYREFLVFRLAIGVIGGSFVITQFHMALLFSDRVKGTASAIVAGWGNLGGGAAHFVMPLIYSLIIGFGFTPHAAWRYAMVVPAGMMWVMAFLYYRYTGDTPGGELRGRVGDLRGGAREQGGARMGRGLPGKRRWAGYFRLLADRRVVVLICAYASCFGVEITFDNVASIYFVDDFHLSTAQAGLCVGIFGSMNLFARALGGLFCDRFGMRWGMRGRGGLLAMVLVLEGVGLIVFAHSEVLAQAVGWMLVFGFFLKLANGVVYGIVPFVHPGSMGRIGGLVGAGGNLGGLTFGFLFRSTSLHYVQAFGLIGLAAAAVGILVSCIRWEIPESGAIIPGTVVTL